MSRARFAAVVLHLPDNATSDASLSARQRRMLWVGASAVLAILLSLTLWSQRPGESPAAYEVFVFEDVPAPPLPDPAPPPPRPAPKVREEAPPPQFGLRQEDVADPAPESEHPESDDMEVALGNTLMTGADSVVKPPPPPLPRVPERLDQPLRIARGRAPEYPPRALARGLQGVVDVLITVDTLGRVRHATVEKSGGALFDGSALRNARRLIFQPYVRDGRPREVSFTRRYEFTLE